jgi:hypothetical protein
MVARILPAFVGTHLYRFECAACNHVLETLRAHDDRHGAKFARPFHTRHYNPLSIFDADPFAPYGQVSRHDHRAEEEAKQPERLHPANNSDQHQQEWYPRGSSD